MQLTYLKPGTEKIWGFSQFPPLAINVQGISLVNSYNLKGTVTHFEVI